MQQILVSALLFHIACASHVVIPRDSNAVAFPISQLDGLIANIKQNMDALKLMSDILKSPIATADLVISQISSIGLANLPIPAPAAKVIKDIKTKKVLSPSDKQALDDCRALAIAFYKKPIYPKTTPDVIKNLYLLGSVPVWCLFCVDGWKRLCIFDTDNHFNFSSSPRTDFVAKLCGAANKRADDRGTLVKSTTSLLVSLNFLTLSFTVPTEEHHRYPLEHLGRRYILLYTSSVKHPPD